MTRLGRRRGSSRKLLILLSVVSLLSGMLFVASSALAVNNTGAFELEGNPTTEPAVAGNDDADRVCYQDGINEGLTAAAAALRCTATQGLSTGGSAASWVDASAELTIFTGGGSKDIDNPGTSWAWKPKDTIPDKDTIEHAFAARYSLAKNAATCPAPATATTCEVIYFGVDRFDNSGDAQLGFWFFKNQIGLGSTARGGGFAFTGNHQNGDLLLISQFSNGGTTSTIEAHFWDTACTKAANNNPQAGQCSAANLRLQQKSTQANCATSSATAPFCGIVNPTNGTSSAWAFTDKTTGDAPNQYLQGEYYEAGVNLSQLGIGDACFPSFVAESRSSTSTTAVLKDFVLGNFQNCSATAVTTPSSSDANGVPGSVSPGTAVTDTIRITGAGTSNPPFPSSATTAPGRGNNVIFRICGPMPAPELCDGSTGHVGTQVGASKPLSPTTTQGVSTATSDAVNTAANPLAPGRYCFSGSWAGDDNYPTGARDSSSRECFTVTDTTSMASTQNWLPNDSATVTAGGSTPLSGTLTATLYLSANCTGSIAQFPGTTDNVTYSKTLTNATTAADRTLTTSNTTFKVTTSQSVSWKVEFTSTNANVSGSSHCESTSLTITN